MEIKVSRVNSANAIIEGFFSKSNVESRVEKIAKDASRTMKVDGFRKGKVPVAVIKRRFGEKLLEDAKADALKELVSSALKELDLNFDKIIGEPQVTKYDESDEKTDVEVKLGIKPEFEIGDYESIIPSGASVEVTDSEIDERIKEIAKNYAPINKIEEDRAVQNGDFALIDFDGYVDGEPLDNGKAEGYSLEIGSNSFIPGFEEQVIGMKAGEEKEIDVTFPADYGKAELAGKPVKFKIKLHTISTRGEVEVNDDLAKKTLGEEGTLESLKEKIKETMKREKLAKVYNDELKPALIEKLIEHYTFDLPEFVIEQEIDLSFRNKLQSMSEDEINELKESKEKAKEIRETLRDDATKSVKVTFIIDALAKKEGVEISENEIMQTIYYEAMQFGQDPKAMFDMYKQQNLLPAIKMAMIEDKLLTLLLDKKLEAK
jgi:trigger factor